MKYLLPFITAFVISALLCWAMIYLAKHIPAKSRKGKRHSHVQNVSRFGGVAIIISFAITLLVDQNLVLTEQLNAVLFASFLILVFGLVDDVFEISWKKQFVLQLVAVIVVCSAGVGIRYLTNPLGGTVQLTSGILLAVGYVLAGSWIILLMNSLNWIDGTDGLSGGISAIAASVIFLLSLKPEVYQPPIAIVSVALLGALIGFLIFNIYPAKIMAGTSGSLFMGFILASLSIVAGTKIATTLLVLSIPILDALWVVFERIRSRTSIFEADTRHMHHRLLDLGWSHRLIWIFFCSITALIAVIALNTRAMGKAYSILLVSLIILAVSFFLRCRVALQQKTRN